jgi:hypothetical protein
MVDADLAELCSTSTKALNQAVIRNLNRFPSDFMFQLSSQEKSEGVTECDPLAGIKFSKSLPYAFTEHGAIMAANVLNSARAVEMSVFVVRAFFKIREALSSHKELSRKLTEVENKVGDHDDAIKAIVLTIRDLMDSPRKKTRKIGF